MEDIEAAWINVKEELSIEEEFSFIPISTGKISSVLSPPKSATINTAVIDQTASTVSSSLAKLANASKVILVTSKFSIFR